MISNKVTKPEIPSQPMRRPRRSSSESSTSSRPPLNLNLQHWCALKNSLASLNKKNFSTESSMLISKFRSIVLSDGSQSASTATSAVLYIVYERSLQELLLHAYPVSTTIVDSLSNFSDDVFNTVQPLIQQHLKQLQTKLQSTAKLSGIDVGVICLLVNMCKREQILNQAITVTPVLEQILKDTYDFIDSDNVDVLNDSLVILLYLLLWFCLQHNVIGLQFDALKRYMRKCHIKNFKILSKLGRVLAIDIIERFQNVDHNAKIYNQMYKKLIGSEVFLLSGIEDVLFITVCPLRGEDVNNGIKRQDSEDIDIGNSLKRLSVSSSSSSNEDPDESKWTTKVSSEVKMGSFQEEKEEIQIEIPERYVGRVSGLQDAILRKLELQSNASISISDKETIRPKTTSLTAHRLITGALGVRAQMSKEQQLEEKQKISDARVKRQTDKNVEQKRKVKIRGSIKEIGKAKCLIDEIITNIVTVTIPLDYNVDDLLEKYSDKLKTIEILLNVYMEIIEEETFKVSISISGDKKSCSDAKTLMIEELATFRTRLGQMFYIPGEMKSLLKSKFDVEQLINIVRNISQAQICEVVAPKGQAIFVSGLFNNIHKAIDIFQAANAQLLSASCEESVDVTLTDLCIFIEKKFSPRKRELRRSLSKSPTLLKEKIEVAETDDVFVEEERQVIRSYTRQRLLELARIPYAKSFPDTLKSVMVDDPAAACVILPQGISDFVYQSIIRSSWIPRF